MAGKDSLTFLPSTTLWGMAIRFNPDTPLAHEVQTMIVRTDAGPYLRCNMR